MVHFSSLLVVFMISVIGCHSRKVNIVFVVDISENIGRNNLQLAFQFIPKYLDYYSISRSNTRVALFTFASTVRRRFKFRSHGNRKCLLRGIRKLQLRLHSFGSSKGLKHALLMSLKACQAYKTKSKQCQVILLTTTSTLSQLSLAELGRIQRKFQYAKVALRTFVFGHHSRRVTLMHGTVLHSNSHAQLRRLFRGRAKFTDCSGSGHQYDECNRKCKCRNGKLTSCVRIRKEFTTFTPQERKRYIKAYKKLSSSPEYKKRYEAITIIHKKYFWSGIHKKDQFFPWHRWYLLEFENLLREVDCRITVPFWDWSYWSAVAWNTKLHVWRRNFLGGNGKPLKDYCVQDGPFRRTAFKTPSYENSKFIYNYIKDTTTKAQPTKAILPHPYCVRRDFNGRPPTFSRVKKTVGKSLKDFKEFEVVVRDIFHNAIHCAIGGTMCTTYASSTPEFWMHHGMLDYIWYRWQIRSRRHRDAYFKHNSKPLKACRFQSKDLLNIMDLPGCVAVKYKLFRIHGPAPIKELIDGSLPAYQINVKRRRQLFQVSDDDAVLVDKVVERMKREESEDKQFSK